MRIHVHTCMYFVMPLYDISPYKIITYVPYRANFDWKFGLGKIDEENFDRLDHANKCFWMLKF